MPKAKFRIGQKVCCERNEITINGMRVTKDIPATIIDYSDYGVYKVQYLDRHWCYVHELYIQDAENGIDRARRVLRSR